MSKCLTCVVDEKKMNWKCSCLIMMINCIVLGIILVFNLLCFDP